MVAVTLEDVTSQLMAYLARAADGVQQALASLSVAEMQQYAVLPGTQSGLAVEPPWAGS
jgi:hypothetical protein